MPVLKIERSIMTTNAPVVIDTQSATSHLHTVPPSDRIARQMALQANLRPFAKKLHALVTSFGRKAPMLEVARIVIVECLEAGYTTETWIRQVSYGLPLKTSDILWVLWHERGRDRLWDCNDDEKYSLNPDT
jgi:hypothetical protein